MARKAPMVRRRTLGVGDCDQVLSAIAAGLLCLGEEMGDGHFLFGFDTVLSRRGSRPSPRSFGRDESGDRVRHDAQPLRIALESSRLALRRLCFSESAFNDDSI